MRSLFNLADQGYQSGIFKAIIFQFGISQSGLELNLKDNLTKDLVLIFLLGLATPKGCFNLASVERSETVKAHTFNQFILGIFRMLQRKNQP